MSNSPANSTRRHRSDSMRSEASTFHVTAMQRGIGVALFLAALIIAVWGVSFSWRLWHAEQAAIPARVAVERWSTGKEWTAEQWLKAEKQLLEALEWTPDNPNLHDELASLYMLQGGQYAVYEDENSAEEEAERRSYFQSALNALLQSLQLRPHHGATWANLALVAYELAPGSEQQWHAWQQAQRWSPYEDASRSLRAYVALLSWGNASAEVKLWLANYYNNANAVQKKQVDGWITSYGLDANVLKIPPTSTGQAN